MKLKRYIISLVWFIAVLSTVSCLFGLLSKGGTGGYEYKSINNEIVKIYGYGLYKNDSVSIAAQGKASDFVTLIMAVPLLILSLYFSTKESFKGKILLTGTLGYFLYTYMSYTFLWMYNKFFIVYVMLMSASLFAFILSITSFDLENIKLHFSKKLPAKFLGGYQIFIAVIIGMLWLGKILPSIIEDKVPVGLEHYTTLVIQGMDLGIIVPTALLSGIFLIKRKPLGYLLSSVIIIKGITMLTSISAMILNQALNGVKMSIVEVTIFPLFNLVSIICLVLLLKNTKNHIEMN
ncbi:hypothetical protein Q428_04105 [Fervidicella metallireducens AeB]|uniref:Lipoprotein n=1 Tax=Fervidicella metallireducens AeB TaxID=1403537 RepID=A0A017RWT7_9CLOT|nr:hypothetical protein [Fervidicella metallireducens]EYE89132.1 hypothetical protein Q428_04105 [Fervidicella metallireducens AeB]